MGRVLRRSERRESGKKEGRQLRIEREFGVCVSEKVTMLRQLRDAVGVWLEKAAEF